MPFLLLTHLQLPLIHISKSWSPAVSWRTENTVWNIEPTGSSQNQKSLDRDLPTEFVNHYVARLRRVGSFWAIGISDAIFTAQCCVLYSSQTNCILYCANNLWGNHSPSIITIPKLCSTPQIISKVSLCNFSKQFQVGVVLLKLNCKFVRKHFTTVAPSFEWGVMLVRQPNCIYLGKKGLPWCFWHVWQMMLNIWVLYFNKLT